jgi:hypothetical protein
MADGIDVLEVDIISKADTKGFDDISKASNQMNNNMKNIRAAMFGLSLNALFVGMQIQRTFEGIARTTVDTFLKIKASAGPTFSAIQAVGAAFDFLSFAVGEAISSALEPFLPLIMDIVDSIVDFVEQNGELVGTAILLGIVFGALLSTLGQIGLIITPLALLLGPAQMAGVVAGLTGAIQGLALAFPLVVAGIILLAAAWKTNFAGMQDIVKSLANFLGTQFGTAFDDLVTLATDTWALIKSIFEGDSKKTVDKISDVFFGLILIIADVAIAIDGIIIAAIAFISKAFVSLALNIQEIFMMMAFQIGKSIYLAIVNALNSVIPVVNNWIKTINEAIGTNIQPLKPLSSNQDAFARGEATISGFSDASAPFNALMDKTNEGLLMNLQNFSDLIHKNAAAMRDAEQTLAGNAPKATSGFAQDFNNFYFGEVNVGLGSPYITNNREDATQKILDAITLAARKKGGQILPG